ncbi:MAG: SpoIIE family protein phosphatase [Deltaproteobacteria bacterium]|nr:SpoIIE family protein phosphatase [Deltaproteobacteria bacterium]
MQPTPRLSLKGFAINSNKKAATQLNGDMVYILKISPFRIALSLIDVSGHGAAAAMLTGMIHGWLHSHFNNSSTLPELTTGLNQYLLNYTPASMYVTGFIGILDTMTGSLEYILAGHPEPLFWQNNACRFGPQASTPVLGMHEGFSPVVSHCHLMPGDAVMIYSDGLLDVLANTDDAEGHLCNLYAQHNCNKICLRNRRCSMLDDILSTGNIPIDDMTMLCITRFHEPLYFGSLELSTPKTGHYELTIPSREGALQDLYSFMVDNLQEEIGATLFWDMLQIVMELTRNAMEWGNGFDATKKISCSICLTGTKAQFTVEDEGNGFDTGTILERARTIDPEGYPSDNGRPGGFGIAMAFGLADQLVFNEKGNRVTARFFRNVTDQHS